MSQPIKIGISACLLGDSVRYDGGHRLDPYLKETLGRSVEWIPFCPEVECGLGVPREPMHLVDDGRLIRLVTIDTACDHTGLFLRWLEKKLAELESTGIRGFVLKARSPSCGVRDVSIVDPSGCEIRKGAGLFTAALKNTWHSLPVEDEGSLHDNHVRGDFMERVQAYMGTGKHFV